MERLQGKVIAKILINDARDLLELDLDGGGRLYASAVGDCCSKSWFEHIEGLDALLGQKINKVIEREMPGAKDDSEFDVVKFYGWTLETDKGRCDIEMRNRSNGYYGGEVEIDEQPLDQYTRVRERIGHLKVLDNDF